MGQAIEGLTYALALLTKFVTQSLISTVNLLGCLMKRLPGFVKQFHEGILLGKT